jgi:hypothetical protein
MFHAYVQKLMWWREWKNFNFSLPSKQGIGYLLNKHVIDETQSLVAASQLRVIGMEMNGMQRLSCPSGYARATACIKYQLNVFHVAAVIQTGLSWALHLPLNANCHTENVESERSRNSKKTAEQLRVAIKAKGDKNLVSRSIICFTYTSILLWRTSVLDNINPTQYSRCTSVAVVLLVS